MAIVTTTIGFLSRTYTTIGAWEADLDNTTIYVSGDDAVGEVYDDIIYNESVSIVNGGIVGLASRKLTVPLGHRHSGVAGSGARIVRTISHSSVIFVNISKTTIEWLECDSNATLNSEGVVVKVGDNAHPSDPSATVFNHMLVHAGVIPGAVSLGGIVSKNRPISAIRNTVFSIKGESTQPGTPTIGIGRGFKCILLNNTVFGISTASQSTAGVFGIMLPASSTHRCQNNISVGTTNTGTGGVEDFSTITPAAGQLLDHNISSDTSAIGAGSIISTAASTLFVSSVAGSEDLHLVNASAAQDAALILGIAPDGVDLAMPTTGFLDGLDLTINPQGTSWEIGAYEFLTADSGTPGILPMSVTDDMTVIADADTIAGWQPINNTSGEALDPDIKVQGTNSVSCRVNGIVTPSGLIYDIGASTDLSNKHLYIWGFTMQKVDTKALGGWRIRVSTDVDGASNYGEWFVGGSDTVVGANGNFQAFVVDTTRAFDAQAGIPPALTAVFSIGVISKFLTANGRISFFLDNLRHGTGITIEDGTDAAPATFSAVAVADKAVGRGVTTSVGKGSAGETVFVCGSVTIGNEVSGGHVFRDSNFSVVWEDMPVSPGHNKLRLVGNTGGFGDITFGTKIGTGNNEVGIGGGSYISYGPRFLIEVIDTGLNRGNFYGTTIIRAAKINLAHQNAKYISCNLDDCDEVIVSGSAVCKRTNISNSLAVAVRILANPSTSNFRDDRIQNSPIGISFASTIPGGVVDLAAITFLGNANDIEVTGTGAVTINVTEQGSTPQNILTPQGATVTVNKFVLFNLDNVLAGSKIYVEADPGGPLADGTVIVAPVIEPTSVFSKLLNYTVDQPFRAMVVLSTTAPFYKPEKFVGVITGTGFVRRLSQALDQ